MRLLTVPEAADLVTTEDVARDLCVSRVLLALLYRARKVRAHRAGTRLLWERSRMDRVRAAASEWALRPRPAHVPPSVLTEDQIVSALPFRGSVVYFVQAEAGGLIKIGTTNDMIRRFACLQASCPIPLRLLWASSGGAKYEARYHKRFAAHRAHGEWFEPHPEILDFLTSMHASGRREL